MMRSRLLRIAAVALVLALALSGCQTAKQVAPAQSTIQVEESGFAPQGAPAHSTIELQVLFGNPELVKSWVVGIAGNGTEQRRWSGGAESLPDSLRWDGTDGAGNPAPEGTYVARLAVDYTKTYEAASVESRSFVLVRTPPGGSIVLDPQEFVPAEGGVAAPMTLRIDARSSLAALDSWALEVSDPAGGLVYSADGRWPAASATWDGSRLGGGHVEPLRSYRAVATVRDVYGLASKLRADVPVADIPPAENQDIVGVRAAGFSPRSTTAARTIEIVAAYGNRTALKSWKVSVAHVEFGVQKSWRGDASVLSPVISWDGTTADGTLAPEGTYRAFLSIDYGATYKPVFVRSGPFIVDYTPPACSASAIPPRLAADGRGGILPVTFTLYGKATLAPLATWQLAVLDAAGRSVASFGGQWPPDKVVWNGKLAGGGTANPTQHYTYVASFGDELGNIGEVHGSLVTGELPTVDSGVSVTAQAAGFSPNSDGVVDTMALALSYGPAEAVASWTLAISDGDGTVVRSFEGDGDTLPQEVQWDGRTEDGRACRDGEYGAALKVNYGTVFAPASAQGAPFALVVAPPTAGVSLSTPLFSPLESSDTITLSIDASSPLARIDSWTMDIYDPGGNLFRSFSGKWPAHEVRWDGRDDGGTLVQSAEEYPVQVTVRDEFGNTATVSSLVPVDILVEKRGDGYRILASRIFFKAFTADYVHVPPDLARQNAARLDALAAKLQKFPGYTIRVVGHAVMIFWDDAVRGKAEQEKVLIPLSLARADAVAQALVSRGLEAARFATEGVGAADQLVPDSDYRNRWQNRRVALFLERD